MLRIPSHQRPTDEQILEAVEEWDNKSPTYVVANRIWGYGRNRDTPFILRRLKALEKQGLVKRVPSIFERQYCWSVTTSTPPGEQT